MTDTNSSRFGGLVRPDQIPGMFGAHEEKRYIKRPLTYEDYMEMLSLLKGLESVVGTRQISDYMNALKVAQRNSPVDIDPANVILSMAKLYAEKTNDSLRNLQSSNHYGFSPPPGRAMGNGPMAFGHSAAYATNVETKSPGRLDGQVPSAFQEIKSKSDIKVYTKQNQSAFTGKDTLPVTQETLPNVKTVPGSQLVPNHLLRSQLERNHGIPILSVEKKITNGSYLLRFNVTTDLGRLLPEHQDDMSPGASAMKDAPRSLFKRNISIIDVSGKFFCVKYEGIVSSKQRHNRLTTGWSGVVKALGIKVGDTIIFERWTPNPSIIHIKIVRGNDDWDAVERFQNDAKKKKVEPRAG